MNLSQTIDFIEQNYALVKTSFLDAGGVIKEPAKYIFKNKISELIPELKNTSASNIFMALDKLKFLKIIRLGQNSDYRHELYIFFPKEHNILTIAKALAPNSYFSHYTSLYLNQLTLNQSQTIFIKRKTKKPSLNKIRPDFDQKKIDIAFSKPMRKSTVTNNIEWNNKYYKIIIIEGIDLGQEGLKKIKIEKNSDYYISHSNIERTLIDIIIRPDYSGGLNSIVEAFHIAKENIDIEKMATYLNELHLSYPYERNIAFFMKKANYKSSQIALFLNNINLSEVTYDFYLGYQITNKNYDKEFKIFYPSDLLDKTL